MSLLTVTASLLFRAALASYLLLYAWQLKSFPQNWTPTITHNLQNYAKYIGQTHNNLQDFVQRWLLLYCQWLVLISLFIVSDLRAGKLLGWLSIIANTMVCYRSTDTIFLGINLVILSMMF